jgi:hypothetical protein
MLVWSRRNREKFFFLKFFFLYTKIMLMEAKVLPFPLVYGTPREFVALSF